MKSLAAFAFVLALGAPAVHAAEPDVFFPRQLDPELDARLVAPRLLTARDGGGVVIGASGGTVSPEGRVFGLGLQLGYPTALTLKYMVTGDQGLVVGLGVFSAYRYDAATLSLHVDYLWHPHVIAAAPPFRLSWYIGGGAHVVIFDGNDYDNFAGYGSYGYFFGPTYFGVLARLPLGLNLAFTQIPFELYLELAPELSIFPRIGFGGVGAAIGGRFYF